MLSQLHQQPNERQVSADIGKGCTTDNRHEDNPQNARRLDIETELDDVVPDGGWGWFVMIASLLIHILVGPLASVLCRRFSIRTVILLGASCCTIGTLASVFSPDILLFFLSFGLLSGVGRAFVYGPSLILLGQYFNRRRGLAAGIASSGAALSACIFPILLEGLLTYYGFSGAFLIISALTSHLFVSALLSRPLERQRQERFRQMPIETPTPSIEANKTAAESEKKITETDMFSPIETTEKAQHGATARLLEVDLLKDFTFLCMCTQIILFTLARNSTFTYLPALALSRGIGSMHSAYLLSVMGIFDTLGRILTAVLVDLASFRPYRLVIFNGAMFVMAAANFSMPFMTTFLQFCIASALFGVSIGLYISLKSVVCVDVLGVEHLTSSFGLLLAFQGTGSIMAPTVGGLAKDYLGSYDVAFYIGSVGTCLGGAVTAAGNIWFYRYKNNGYQML